MSVSHVVKLMEFLRSMSRLEKAPGFSYALGLAYPQLIALAQDKVHVAGSDTSVALATNLISGMNRLVSYEYPVLKVRVPIQSFMELPEDYLLNGARPALRVSSIAKPVRMSLSTYLAMIDEVTSMTCVLADPERGRTGVSVSLQVHTGPGWYDTTSTTNSFMNHGDEIDIYATATKIGRSIGYTRAEIYKVDTNDLICFGTHVKFMPMHWLVDFMLSSKGWRFTQFGMKYLTSDPSKDYTTSMKDLFTSFHSNLFDDDDDDKRQPDIVDNRIKDEQTDNNNDDSGSRYRSRFKASSAHASLGGPLHGGCQAIAMEMAAIPVAQHVLGTKQAHLESISVDYLSPPVGNDIQLHVHIIQKQANDLHLRVDLVCKGKTKSQGLLHFITRDFPSIDNPPPVVAK